jgi:hypothetical protein
MNRIRRYFVELASSVADYLISPVSDDVPAFCSADFNPSRWAPLFVNLPGMIAIINSIVGSVLIIGSLVVLFAMSTQCIILLGGVTVTVMFIAHQVWQIVRLKREESKTEICFPSAQIHK